MPDDWIVPDQPTQAAPKAAADDWVVPGQAAAAPQQRGAIDKLLGIGGERYQTWPEKLIRGIASTAIEAPKKFIEAGTAGPPGSEAVTRAAVAPAADIASLFSPMSRAGGLATKLAAPRMVEKAAPAPTAADLLKSARTSYKGVQYLDLQVSKETAKKLVNSVTENLGRAEEIGDPVFSEISAPKTYGIVRRLETLPKETLSLGDVDAARSELGYLSRSREPGAEGPAARKAIQEIDKWHDNITADDIVKGDIADVDTVKKLLAKARPDYRAAMRSERVTADTAEADRAAEFQSAQARGEQRAQRTGKGANLDNALRQEIGRLARDPAFMASATREEKDLIKRIQEGTWHGNLARLFSVFGPKHPLIAWPAAVTADVAGGGLGGATALMGLGAGAQKYSEVATQRLIRKLDEAIRRNSALGRAQPTVRKEQLSPVDLTKAAGVRALLSQLAQGRPTGGNISDLVRQLGGGNAGQ